MLFVLRKGGKDLEIKIVNISPEIVEFYGDTLLKVQHTSLHIEYTVRLKSLKLSGDIQIPLDNEDIKISINEIKDVIRNKIKSEYEASR